MGLRDGGGETPVVIGKEQRRMAAQGMPQTMDNLEPCAPSVADGAAASPPFPYATLDV